VNTLKRDWKESYGLSHILLTIKCLLIAPNPESALNEEAGRLLLEAYDDYCARARTWTSIHARPTGNTAIQTVGEDKEDKGADQEEGKEDKKEEKTLSEISPNPKEARGKAPSKGKGAAAPAAKRGLKRL